MFGDVSMYVVVRACSLCGDVGGCLVMECVVMGQFTARAVYWSTFKV